MNLTACYFEVDVQGDMWVSNLIIYEGRKGGEVVHGSRELNRKFMVHGN